MLQSDFETYSTSNIIRILRHFVLTRIHTPKHKGTAKKTSFYFWPFAFYHLVFYTLLIRCAGKNLLSTFQLKQIQ